jgi:uncharacterized protein (TIGR03067 family)
MLHAISNTVFVPSLATILVIVAQPSTEKTIQGKWAVVSLVNEGKQLKLVNAHVYFEADKMTFLTDRDYLACKFKTNDKRLPKYIDLTVLEGKFIGTVVPGIYKLDDDTLQICLSLRVNKDRPKEFASQESSVYSLFTLKRVKPK